MIFPESLKKGQTIGVYSPSGSIGTDPVYVKLYEDGVQALINAGYKVKEARNTHSVFFHMSATAKDKANDIHELFADPAVKAIIPSVGGHTASQILPFIDISLIKSNPKIFVGFSDSALLASYISERANLVTFHSAVDLMFGFSRFNKDDCPMQNKGNYTQNTFLNMIENMKPFNKPYSNWSSLKNGSAEGILIGGNIKGIQALLGTPYEPNWKGKILYWEAADAPHVIAQGLAHLNNAGVFDKINGLIVGKVSHLKETFYDADEIMPVNDFILYLLESKNIPIITEVDLGHDVENITLPNGCSATMNVSNHEYSLIFNI